ncbi:MAG: radical SAM family heme chaperone HemW [Gemmatimonadaceae bacterium]
MQQAPRHVYVHVPFCARRCSYCDFAIAVRRTVPLDTYLAALGNELAVRLPTAEALPVATIYLGGGTPSRLGAEGVAALLALLRRRFRLEPGGECTIEANPEDVDATAAAAWRAAGITRVSLGVQSFHPAALAWMHRVHDAESARRAARVIAAAGFDSWSLDLIFALPHDLGRDWTRDLQQAVELDPPHLSLYGLTVEPATPLARWVERGITKGAPDTRWTSDFLLAHERLTRSGYVHYEVSNYARAAHTSRHNAAYWNGASYIAFGPAAHSYDGATRRWNTREYQAWVRACLEMRDPLDGSEELSSEQHNLEDAYLALRTQRGLATDLLPHKIVEQWCANEWATASHGRLRLTPLGWLRVDALTSALTAHPNRC